MVAVIDWLTFYSHRRLHAALDHISPVKFGESWPTDLVKKAAQARGCALCLARAWSVGGDPCAAPRQGSAPTPAVQKQAFCKTACLALQEPPKLAHALGVAQVATVGKTSGDTL